MNALAGAGEAARIDHGDEAAQQVEIQHAVGLFIHKSTDINSII
jgi:hypothetical protein